MKQSFIIQYILISVVQVLICNYFYVSPYIILSIVPAAILCLPSSISNSAAMLIAFVTGLVVDLLAEGLLGLNTLALVPVAASRGFLREAIFGKEMTASGEDISIKKYGSAKVAFALAIAQTIFLALYIWADGASARPLTFNLLRFILSLPAGTLTCLVIVHCLDPYERR